MTIHVDENTTLDEILANLDKEDEDVSIFAVIKAVRLYRDKYHSDDVEAFKKASKILIDLCLQTSVHRDEKEKVLREFEIRNITDTDGITR